MTKLVPMLADLHERLAPPTARAKCSAGSRSRRSERPTRSERHYFRRGPLPGTAPSVSWLGRKFCYRTTLGAPAASRRRFQHRTQCSSATSRGDVSTSCHLWDRHPPDAKTNNARNILSPHDRSSCPASHYLYTRHVQCELTSIRYSCTAHRRETRDRAYRTRPSRWRRKKAGGPRARVVCCDHSIS
jgi:hypothetical protein